MNARILKKTHSIAEDQKIVYEVFIGVCYILTNVFLFLTATSDPGIVYSSPFTDDEQASFNLDQIPYCDICSVYQVQRMHIHHCEDCNYCIEGMDHHCPWMVRAVTCKNPYRTLTRFVPSPSSSRASALARRI